MELYYREFERGVIKTVPLACKAKQKNIVSAVNNGCKNVKKKYA
jgi:hypothetical protein